MTTMAKNEDVFAVSSMMEEVDAIIAQNLNELSSEDREKSYLDVHGISGALRETPLLIAQSLTLMEQEIDQIQGKDAYDVAKSMSPDYVRSTALRLKFLRGERFSVRPAAEKFVKHFEAKQLLFGTSKLVKDIEQDDLNEEDIATLYSGYVQWSPLKDSSQRAVAIMFPFIDLEKFPAMSRTRVSFYLRMIAMEDLDFQRHGTVILVSAEDWGSNLDFSRWRGDSAKHTGNLTEALPGSIYGVHICFPQNGSFRSYLFSTLLKITVSVLNPLLNVRVRIHRGQTMEECMSCVQSFGIQAAGIPMSPEENEYQTKLLENRRKLERKRRDEKDNAKVEPAGMSDTRCDFIGELVCGPGKHDVILGRGPKCNLHPGNIRLRKLVNDAKSIYDQSRKRDKSEIIARLVLAVQKNGRFLLESDVGWVEVTDKVARQKVSHTFRDIGKKWKKKSSSTNLKKSSIEARKNEREEIKL